VASKQEESHFGSLPESVNHNPENGVRDHAFYFFRFQFTQSYAPTFPCYPPRLGTGLGTAICPHVWREGGL
jgi:hypothetical protein